MITIPIKALPAYTFGVTLEDIPLLFTVRWNVRGAYYTLDILTRDAVLIIGGIKLVINSLLIGKFPLPGLPRGDLALVDSSGNHAPVEYGDLGTRAELVYVTEAELAAVR